LEDQRFDYTSYQSQKDIEPSLEKPNQLQVTDDKMAIEESTKSSESTLEKEIIHLEFSIGRGEVQNYLDSLKSDTDDVWFNCIVDLNAGDVIYAKIGRQQQNVAEKSSRNDTATAYTVGKNENEQ
jgi:hypothetical protein